MACKKACMSLSWDDINTVSLLVEEGSLAGAAARLGVNYTTVSRRISRIEAALDETLFIRSAEGYAPTQAAHIVSQSAVEMSGAADDMLRKLSASSQILTGSLTITAPQLLIARHLAIVLRDFRAQYPDMSLNIRATNQILDLNRPSADLAIRISNSPDEMLIGQRLTRQSSMIYGVPELARRAETTPQEMVQWVGMPHWKTPPKAALATCPNWEIAYRFDDMVAVIGAALSGLGLVRLPKFLGDAESGLVRVNIMPPKDYWDIWALTHPDLKDAPKVRAFKQVLIPYFKSHQSDFLEQG